MPKQLLLELSSACNLRCKMCAHTKYMTGKSLSTDAIPEILSDVRRLNEENPSNSFYGIRLDGNSEPLVYKGLKYVIQERNALLPEVPNDIVTNGVLLNEDISRCLLAANTGIIHISVTGLTPKTYREFQGSNLPDNVCERNLQKVKDNVISLINAKKEMGAKTIIEMRYILSGASMNEFIPYLKYWSEQGVDQIYVTGLGDGTLKTVSRQVGKVISYKPCEFFGQIIVQATGDVILSCCNYRMEVVGNVYKESFFDIMTSDNVLKYEKAHKELDIKNLPEICVNCPVMHKYENNKSSHFSWWGGIGRDYRNMFLSMAQNKKLIIWGTGPEFELVNQTSYIGDCDVSYLIDNNTALWNSIVSDLQVKPPDKLKEEDCENTVVLVASAHFLSISNQLKDLGIKHFYPSLIPSNYCKVFIQ